MYFNSCIMKGEIYMENSGLSASDVLALTRGSGDGFGFDGADFRNGNLHIAEKLQQEGLKFLVSLVYFVNQ